MNLAKLKNGVTGLLESLPITVKDRLNLPLKPKWVWIELTDKCNSRCKPCNVWRRKPTPKNVCLSPKQLYTVLSNPLLSDVKYVLNSGGECTLVDLKAYLKAEHKALPEATLQISSNALLPTRLLDAVHYALELGVPIDVGLSIDGIGKNHDRIRGVKGNFRKLERAIQSLKELQNVYPRLRVSMGSTLTDLTVDHAEELYGYSRRMDIPFSWHWYSESPFYGNFGSCTTNKTRQVIDKLPSFSLYWSMWQRYLASGKLPRFRCFALKTFFALRCDGRVVPCLSRWNRVVGNVKRTPIHKIWRNCLANRERESVANCLGCMNSWAVGWSIRSHYYPKITHFLKGLLH